MDISPNKQVVEKFGECLFKGDRAGVLSCITDDAEWTEWESGIPGSGLPKRGKAAIAQNVDDPANVGNVQRETTRMTEENDVVVAEGTVRVPKKEGGFLTLKTCSVFEFEHSKIRRLNSFIAEVKSTE